jgi:hypothetical protein
MSSESIEKVLELAPQMRHSYFQLSHFVIGKEPTVQGKMWQCLRELQARKEATDSIRMQIEEIKDNLDLLDIQNHKEEEEAITTTDELKNAILQREQIIKKRKYARQKTILMNSLYKLEKELQYAEEESKFFLQTFHQLQKIEPLKDYDDVDAQQEYWSEKAMQEINLKLLLCQPINIETARTILQLNDNAPVKIQFIKMLNHRQACIEGAKCQKD